MFSPSTRSYNTFIFSPLTGHTRQLPSLIPTAVQKVISASSRQNRREPTAAIGDVVLLISGL